MSDDMKHDDGKPRMDLVIDGFADALKEVGLAAAFGCKKYKEDSWVSVPGGLKRYKAALYRHSMTRGLDDETMLLHATLAAWNALAVLQLTLNKIHDDECPLTGLRRHE